MNFKSFKGLHTVSRLDDHLTAIVGPNGSGKSNIIDSILFVLGFKAKKMRHTVLKDLINSSIASSGLDNSISSLDCYVELLFDQFKISRRLRMQGKSCISVYLINDFEVSSSEAIEFIKEKGIDLDNNRFLILQGEIETISMMNPLELLDYIEDCIGSSFYREKVENLSNEIQVKENELESLNNSLKFIESDFLFKKSRRDGKMDVLRYKNESLILKNRIVLVKAAICSRKEIGILNEKRKLEDDLKDLNKKNQACQLKIKECERMSETLNIKEREDNLLKVRREYQRIERESKAKDSRRTKLEAQIKKIKQEMSDNQQAVSNWMNESRLLRNNIIKNDEEIERYEKQIKKHKNEMMKETNKSDGVVENERKKVSLENRLLKLIEEKEGASSNGVAVLKSKLSMLNEKIEKCKSMKRFDKAKLEGEVSQLKNDISSTFQEINKRKRRAEDFQFVEQAYRREKEVNETLKKVPGVFGFLKDLGSIENGYEEAVEASTKSLSSIVVDTTSTAEECISIINRKKLNRTTFIILDKLSNSFTTQNKTALLGEGELLYKRIQCEERFTKCFYFALKDTLCVKTLEEAKALALGSVRKRVVTMDGKLLEKSGVMSGGKVNKKLKSSEELESIYKNMKSMLESKMVELGKIEGYEMERRKLPEYTEAFDQISKEISREASKFDQNKLNELESEIQSTKQFISDLENIKLPVKILELRGEINLLNEKIDCLQKTNQEIKIKLNLEPENNLLMLERDFRAYTNEYESIEIDILPDPGHLKALEEDYTVYFNKFKGIQNEINEIRSKMGNDYHQEAEYKTKLEEIDDSILECKKIKENCIAKMKEIANEFYMARNLILQFSSAKHMINNSLCEDENPPNTMKTPLPSYKNVGYQDLNDRKVFTEDLDKDLPFISELDDQELKLKSKEMIDELNLKESENFRKIKNDMKTEQEFVDEEDIQIYRLIFSEYENSKKEYEELKGSHDFLSEKVISMRTELEGLKNQRLTKFMEGFNAINKNIREIFTMITFGGSAELDLIDYLNPFTDGIVLSIMPPKKAWKQISNLSGGEKTLSSLSLIFALHKYKPSSFYIMDEIDAALDYKNVSVISQYLSRVNAQFIVISLRNDMFEMAKTLLGVYKMNDNSRLIVVDIDKIVQ